MVDLLALSESRSDHKTMRVPVALDLFRSHQHHVYGLPDSMKTDINIPQYTALIKLTAFHHEEIHIAVRSYLFPRGGTKKNDPLWLGYRYNTLNNLFEYFLSDFGHSATAKFI